MKARTRTAAVTAARARRPAVFLLLFLWCLPLAADVVVVTLLGTGTPRPEPGRGSQAVLVEAGTQKLLFDAGRGVAQKIYHLRLDFADIDKVFITHLHYDHIVGLPDLWLSGWVFQRRDAVRVWGPAGIAAHLGHIEKAYHNDVAWRHQHSGLPPGGAQFAAREITAHGSSVVYEKDGLRVTAFAVDHGHVKPALGYRVDYRSRTLVISGDTRYSGALVEQAKAADLLIHELAAVSQPYLRANKRLRGVYDYHTKPDELVRVVKQAKPRLTVLVHRLIFGLEPDAVLAEIRAAAGDAGDVMFGEDLDAFDVGEQIRVYRR